MKMSLLLLLLLAVSACHASWSGVLISGGQGTQIWHPTGQAETDVNFNIAPYSSASAVKMAGKAYFLGGRGDDYKMHQDVLIFDPVTNVTIKGPPLTNKYDGIDGIVAATIGDKADTILACGTVWFNCVCEKFTGGEWSAVASPPGSCNNFQSLMVVHDGQAYLMGSGQFGGKNLYVYDTASDTWLIKSPAPIRLMASGGVSVNAGSFMVCGGLYMSNTGVGLPQALCLAYETIRDEWIRLPQDESLNAPRANFQMINYAGRIYALGGEIAPAEQVNSVELFDLATGKWQVVPNPLPFREENIAAVPIVDSK